MARILIIEDDPAMQRGLRDNLEIDGHDVEVIGDGESGLSRLLAGGIDLVLLDVMLPRLSGFDVLRRARGEGAVVPVILLTAKGEEIDRVLGLELGADDYVTKPFSLRELLARVKAVLRRATEPAAPAESGGVTIGRCTFDLAGYTATCDGTAVTMTPKEFDVLRFLWEHRNQAVSREQLLTSVWGYDETPSTRTVDNFILRLRQKIEEDPAHPRHILTLHGTGYRLVV
jgi:DNA-binding response OmpR family regulator